MDKKDKESGRMRLHIFKGGSAKLRKFLKEHEVLPESGSRLNDFYAWDLARGAGWQERFLEKLAGFSIVACAGLDGKPLALAWLAQIGLASGELHFMVSARGQRQAIVRAGEALLASLDKCFLSLLCLIPRPFHGARALAWELGFRQLGVLKKSCLFHNGRAYDGCLYLRENRSLEAQGNFI